MPRALRSPIVGAVYHITARGNNRDPVMHSEHDPAQYLQLLIRTRERYGTVPMAYALLTNHVHLVVRDAQGSISAAMQYLHGCYASWVNRTHHRTNHLFGARFFSRVIDSDAYLLEVTRYVHLNPVRAGLGRGPRSYPWSSYRAFVDAGVDQSVVDPSSVLDLLSADRHLARDAYRRFVEEPEPGPETQPQDEDDSGVLVRIRDLILRSRSPSEPPPPGDHLNGRRRAVFLYIARALTPCSCGDLAAFLNCNVNSVSSALTRLSSKLRADLRLAEWVNTLLSQASVVSVAADGKEFTAGTAKTEQVLPPLSPRANEE